MALDTPVIAGDPHIIPRPDHPISRQHISDNALKVLYRLHKSGFDAYLVGGGVRDLLLGIQPKDFDIATNAEPDEVRALFKNCRLIGRRFRLAHVRFGREIIEVATFRALAGNGASDDREHDDDTGRILRDNVFGSLEEDAFRRDFTVNALYYNIADFSVVDYTGAMADIRDRLLRLIGDPETRYREDPVRMLRAARFAAKLNFDLAPETAAPIPELASLLGDVPPARLFDEVLKLFMSGQAVATFDWLRKLNLFAPLFPMSDAILDESEIDLAFVRAALRNTDKRIAADKPVTPAFLFAAFLWPAVKRQRETLEADGASPAEALAGAASLVAAQCQHHVAVPRRFSTPMREMWQLQPRLGRTHGKRVLRMLGHPRFRAAYDFLLLRAEAGDADPTLAEFWTELQEMPADKQRTVISQPGGDGDGKSGGKRRRRRRPRGRRKSPKTES